SGTVTSDAYSASPFLSRSPWVMRLGHGDGGVSRPNRPFTSDTPYASAPAFTVIAPGSATVTPVPLPEAWRVSPNAAARSGATPVQALISTPPSATGTESLALTRR